jgi:hypothetical protein
MSAKLVLGAGAMLASLALSAAPSAAFSFTEAPRNADGSARFTDPDAAFDQQAEAFANGRTSGEVMTFGDRARAQGPAEEQRQHETLAHRRHGDFSCIECSSVYVDGLWVLQPQRR